MLNSIVGILGNGAAAGGGTSFESIATATPSGTNTVTFSSIPSTYKHLQIRFNAMVTSAGQTIYMRFNGDTGNNYNKHRLVGNGTAASAGGTANSTSMEFMGTTVGQGTTYPSCGVLDFLDYADTNKVKVYRGLAGFDANGSGEIDFTSGSATGLGTPALSSITLYLTVGNFAANTSFALYGIKGA